MDLNNLFPTAGTSGCGYSSNQFSQSYTNTIANTGVSDAYFLGYVSPDLLPSTSFATTVRMEDDSFVLEPVSKNNALIGYSWTTGMQYADAFKDNVGNNSYSNGLGNTRYWNNFYPEFGSFPNTLLLHFFGTVYAPDSSLVGITSDLTFTANSYANMLRVLNGYMDITLTSNSKTFNFKFSDIVDGHASVTSSDGFFGSFWLKSFSFSGDSRYNGSNSYNSYSNYGFNIKTYGDFEDSSAGSRYILGTTFGSQNYLAMYYPAASYDKFRLENYGRNGGIFNKVTFTELPTSVNPILYNNGVLVHYQGQYNIAFYTYITNPNSIINVLSLCFRTNPGGVASYITNMSYATSVQSGQFVATLKTGDINDPQFKAGLEPWQYVDIETYDPVTNPQGVAVNVFTDEDVPPYEPPIPPPEPGEEGDNPDNPDAALGQVDDTPADEIEEDRMNDARTVFGANTFITQYVLTLSQLTALGQYLWSGITDPNSETLKNFVAIFSDTGTFNSANCMQCFVSLKVFPFDMFNTVYSTTAPDLRAGSGHTALLSESVTIFSSCTYSIDCGTVDVTADGYTMVSGQYDFRNYVNATVCVFLPFCGTVELNPADVFGFTLSCMYYIDVSSGSCTACVFVDRGDNKRLMVASKSGQIGFNIPMSATNAMQVAGTFMSDAASAAQTITNTVLSLATARTMGSIGASGASGANTAAAQQSNAMATSTAAGKTTSGLFGAVSGLGNMLSRGGCAYPSLSGGTGMAALFFDKTPYVVIRRSNYSSPNNYAHTTGFATTDGGTEHKSTLGAYSGWTVVKNCDLKNIRANREELDEIKHLLETGVYL